MLATPVLRAAGGPPGFWKRSVDEFKRQATIAVTMGGLTRPTEARPLISFEQPGSIDRCKIMCDSTMLGGFSKASFTHQVGAKHTSFKGRIGSGKEAEDDGEKEQPAHALFKGSISTELPPNRPEVHRSGFAAWRTRDQGYWLFGKLIWDIDPYQYLALRIKSDGRRYFVNIQTESIVPTDLHQHLLMARTPGRWETVHIPFNSFVRTNHGMVVEPQREILREKVTSVGIGLTDRVPGPFEIRIADVYATNLPPLTKMSDSGFEVQGEHALMGETNKARKKGEPDQILI